MVNLIVKDEGEVCLQLFGENNMGRQPMKMSHNSCLKNGIPTKYKIIANYFCHKLVETRLVNVTQFHKGDHFDLTSFIHVV